MRGSFLRRYFSLTLTSALLTHRLSVRDVHTDENSPADIALQAASRVKAKTRTSIVSKAKDDGGGAASDDDDDDDDNDDDDSDDEGTKPAGKEVRRGVCMSDKGAKRPRPPT